MNARLVWLRNAGLALLLGAVLAGCATGPKFPPAEIAQKIETASTRADHEALATYYLNEAADAKAIAVNHRAMAKSYQGRLPQRSGGSMAAHCNAIARSQDLIAAEYDGMATSHREMAQQAKP